MKLFSRKRGGKEDNGKGRIRGATGGTSPVVSPPTTPPRVGSPTLHHSGVTTFRPTTTPTTTLSVNPAIPNPSNKGEDIFISNIAPTSPTATSAHQKNENSAVSSSAIPTRFAVSLEIPGGTIVVLRCGRILLLLLNKLQKLIYLQMQRSQLRNLRSSH